jgi:hypothetical protein
MLFSGFIGMLGSLLFMASGGMCVLCCLIFIAFLVALVRLRVLFGRFRVVFSRLFVVIVFHKLIFNS